MNCLLNRLFFVVVVALSFFLGSLDAIPAVSTPLSIAIVCLSTPNRDTFSQYTLASVSQYAARWGYAFYCSDQNLATPRHPSWGKIPALIKLLSTTTHDWIVWIDDDIYITNPNKRLDYFIQKCSTDTHLIFSSHKEFAQRPNNINAGLFFVRNSQWAKEFLAKTWNSGNERHNQPGSMYEQDAINELLRTEYKDSPNIAQFPLRTIQSFITLILKGDQGDYGQWQPGDFAAHMAGACEGARVLISQHFVKDLSTYPKLPAFLSEFTIRQD